MTQADRVHSTPPTNTPIDTTRRRFLSQAAVVAAGGAALGVTLPMPVSAGASERVPGPIYAAIKAHQAADPILVAIEAHKAASLGTKAAQRRYADFEDELHANGRLKRDKRTEDERRRGEEIEAALDHAYDAERDAACDLLEVDPTTPAGVVALLTYARDYDDATYGLGWPNDVSADEVDGRRTWHYFLIAKLVEVLRPGVTA